MKLTMIDKKSRIGFALVVSACVASMGVAQDAATTQPSTGVISVSDKAALDANKDKEVVVEGVVSEAQWSGSGKVMNIKFEGTDETKMSAVVFLKNKAKIDEAFGGDAAKAFTGAKLRIRAKLRVYAGKDKSQAGHPEMTISEGSQVTVVEPATSQPAQ